MQTVTHQALCQVLYICCRCSVAKSCLTLCDPMDCSPPGSSAMGFSRQEFLNRLLFPSPGDLSNPGIEPPSPALQAAFLPAEPQGKPNNTGVGSLSLLQWIFLTQELNQGQGFLHCRQILYQLSYQGSPLHELRSSPVCSGPSLHSLILERNLRGYGYSLMHWISYWF